MRNFIVAIAFIILSTGTLYAGVIGDVNNDGKVDLAEAIYSLQVAAGVYPSIDSGCILIGKGAWIENTDYAECDVIESGGLNYVCLQSHTSVTDINAPPNQTYWTQLALKGERGYQGSKGEPGNPMELELPYTFTNQVVENSVTLGDVSAGVYGKNANSNEGSLGTADVGVYGKNLNDNEGSLGTTDVGVYGKNANSGNEGSLGTSNAGIYGKNQNNNEGFLGTANAGVYGKNANNNEGSLGTTDAGVFAKNDLSGNWAKLGADTWALQAKHDISGNQILAGTGDYPLKAERPGQSVILGQSDDIAIQANNGSINTSQNINAEGNITAGGVITVGNNLPEVPTDRDVDIVAEGSIITKGGIKAFGDIYAVDFMGTDGHLWTKGDIKCGGKLEKSAGTFKIDHPLDPKNKYLFHSFVESPDMKNIYDGISVLDESGEAWVDLPEWFEALNCNFRYQLTAVGGPAPNLHIAQKITDNRFKIAGGIHGLEVSWQVTGIRNDAYAKMNRIEVEVEKTEHERGQYLHPEAYEYLNNSEITDNDL